MKTQRGCNKKFSNSLRLKRFSVLSVVSSCQHLSSLGTAKLFHVKQLPAKDYPPSLILTTRLSSRRKSICVIPACRQAGFRNLCNQRALSFFRDLFLKNLTKKEFLVKFLCYPAGNMVKYPPLCEKFCSCG